VEQARIQVAFYVLDWGGGVTGGVLSTVLHTYYTGLIKANNNIIRRNIRTHAYQSKYTSSINLSIVPSPDT